MADKTMSPAEFFKKMAKEDRDAVRRFGKESTKIDFIPTGSWVMNFLIGDGSGKKKSGGFPRGHIVEIFGDESSGKSTLALSACKQAMDLAGMAIYLDYEHTFHEGYARKLGIKVDDEDHFMLARPKYFEQGYRIIKDSLTVVKPALIVVDSVSAMIPKAYLEGKVDETSRIGLQAQLMSKMCSDITKLLEEANTCLIFVNQLRSVIKKSEYEVGPNQETSGGRALRYYSSVRVNLHKQKVEKISGISKVTGKADKEPVNLLVKASIIKNKIDTPHYAGPLYIRFGEGFDNVLSLIELGKNTGVIKTAGAFLKCTVGSKVLFNCQGKEELRSLLINDPKICKILSENLTFKEDEQAKRIAAQEKENNDTETDLDQISENFIKEQERKKKTKENTVDED